MSPSEYQDLVQLLGRQFAAIDGRFAAMDRRFDQVETELRDFRREVLGHFDEIYRRLERFEQEYYAVLQALRRMEAVMADDRGRREIVERDLAELKHRVAALEARIETLEQRLGG
jgi:chromosome segregation ATPase